MFDKLKWQLMFWAAIFALILILVFAAAKSMELLKSNQEINSLKATIAKSNNYTIITTDTIRDTVLIFRTQSISTNNINYKYNIADTKLIKDAKLKPKDIASETNISLTIKDTLPLTKQNHDSTMTFKDNWAEIILNLNDSVLSYKVSDSLVTYISKLYRHKFLFWKWGTKGYQINIINFNPNCNIHYLKHINIHKY